MSARAPVIAMSAAARRTSDFLAMLVFVMIDLYVRLILYVSVGAV